MRRFNVLPAVMLMFLLAMGTSVAVAQTSGIHFTRNGTPTCTITCDTNTGDAACTAEVAGVGESTVFMNIALSGGAVYQCQNHGGNIAPGQNTVLIGPAVSGGAVPGDEIKNGRATLALSTEDEGGVSLTAPLTVSAAVAGCQNNNWTGVNPDLSVTSITFSATQGGVNLFSCTRTSTTDLCGTTVEFTDAECGGEARF